MQQPGVLNQITPKMALHGDPGPLKVSHALVRFASEILPPLGAGRESSQRGAIRRRPIKKAASQSNVFDLREEQVTHSSAPRRATCPPKMRIVLENENIAHRPAEKARGFSWDMPGAALFSPKLVQGLETPPDAPPDETIMCRSEPIDITATQTATKLISRTASVRDFIGLLQPSQMVR
jgi:hypothetical protein